LPATQIDVLINLLDQIRSHPAMYLAPVDGAAALNWVHGMRASVHSLDLIVDLTPDAWWQAQENRGYWRRATGPLPQMKDRGLTAEQMADEVLAIEIEMWRLVQKRTE
jgi:hypothetical protein